MINENRIGSFQDGSGCPLFYVLVHTVLGISAALLAFSLRLSEGGSYLPLMLVDGLYGLDDRKLAVASYANEHAGCQLNCPLEGRAYRLDNAVRDAFVLHGATSLARPPSSVRYPTQQSKIFLAFTTLVRTAL